MTMDKRDAIYQWLTQEFWQFETRLDAEGKVDLDGKLWALAGKIADGKFPLYKRTEL